MHTINHTYNDAPHTQPHTQSHVQPQDHTLNHSTTHTTRQAQPRDNCVIIFLYLYVFLSLSVCVCVWCVCLWICVCSIGAWCVLYVWKVHKMCFVFEIIHMAACILFSILCQNSLDYFATKLKNTPFVLHCMRRHTNTHNTYTNTRKFTVRLHSKATSIVKPTCNEAIHTLFRQ